MDSGNISDNPTAAGDVKTRALVEGMNRLGYRAANVGERDLVLGYGAFMERTAGAAFPFVSSNIVRKDNREPVFEPYVVLEVETDGGSKIKIGVMGVARYNPIFLKAGPSGSNLIIDRPAEALNRYAEKVRRESDIVVLLAAMHREDAREVVRQVEGIDYVVGSYGGMYTTQEDREGSAWLLYSGNQGKRVGETRVFLDAEGNITNSVSFMHFLVQRYPEDATMESFVNGVLAEIAATQRGAAAATAATAGADGR